MAHPFSELQSMRFIVLNKITMTIIKKHSTWITQTRADNTKRGQGTTEK